MMLCIVPTICGPTVQVDDGMGCLDVVDHCLGRSVGGHDVMRVAGEEVY